METVQMNSTVPDYSTVVHASTESDHTEEIYESVQLIIWYISCALTTATLAYGVTSWCFLQKFRNYRNYVLLNAILVNFLVFQWYFIVTPTIRFMGPLLLRIIMGLFMYLASCRIYWLIVIGHMFYVDIVKVFNGHIRRKHLKSALFAWGVPLLTCTTQVLLNVYTGTGLVNFFLLLLPLLLNSLLYIVILWSLFRSSNASANTTSNKRRLFFIATLIFLLSDGFILSSVLLRYLDSSRLAEFVAFLLNRLMTSLILNVYLVIVKRNRELWHEYYVKKTNKRKRNRDIQMNVKNVRQTADKPAIIIAQE